MSLFKVFLRYGIIGLTGFFLLSTLVKNWQGIAQVNINSYTYFIFGISLFFNLVALIFSAVIWSWILNLFNCKLSGLKAIRVYLITNIYKYIPGNIWHFVGRVKAIEDEGDNLSLATIAVIIEPLLMAIAALLITIFSGGLGILKLEFSPVILLGKVLMVILVLVAIKPRFINPVLAHLAKKKGSQTTSKLDQYPLLPLLGEIGFLLMRGIAFLCLFIPFIDLPIRLIPEILTAFSFAWLLGLIVPGAPGGLGIFEATIISLLNPNIFPPEIIIIVVTFFRLSSLFAEILTALVAGFFYNK